MSKFTVFQWRRKGSRAEFMGKPIASPGHSSSKTEKEERWLTSLIGLLATFFSGELRFTWRVGSPWLLQEAPVTLIQYPPPKGSIP
jgi:hypothetical protein